MNTIFKMVQSAYEYNLSGCKMNKKQDKIIFKREKYIFILHFIDYDRTEFNVIYKDGKRYEIVIGPSKSFLRLFLGEEQWYVSLFSKHRKNIDMVCSEINKEIQMLSVGSISA